MPSPLSADRILIFAPHPDDEVLACGGYIFTALKNKAKVKVVIVTLGETFGYALGKNLVNFLPLHEKAIAFGKLRQQEAKTILKKFGLLPPEIEFLGFPDKGLKYLWEKYWSKNNPYFSPILKTNHSPFEDIYQKNTSFSGEELERLITKIYLDFRPTIVITSSPYDRHQDHKTLFLFVQKIISSCPFKNLSFYSFLIHKNHWANLLAYGFRPQKELLPPLTLRKKTIFWLKFPLNHSALLAKERSILSYETQVVAIKKKLLSFVRQNELFHRAKIS